MKTLEFMQSRKQRISISITLSKRFQKFRELNYMKFKNPENWSNCFLKSTFFKTRHVVLKTYQLLHYQHLLVRKSFRRGYFFLLCYLKLLEEFFSHIVAHMKLCMQLIFFLKLKTEKKVILFQ